MGEGLHMGWQCHEGARDKNSIPRAASLGSLQGPALPPLPPCSHLPSLDTHGLLFWSLI